eukprot:gene639-biopygen7304
MPITPSRRRAALALDPGAAAAEAGPAAPLPAPLAAREEDVEERSAEQRDEWHRDRAWRAAGARRAALGRREGRSPARGARRGFGRLGCAMLGVRPVRKHAKGSGRQPSATELVVRANGTAGSRAGSTSPSASYLWYRVPAILREVHRATRVKAAAVARALQPRAVGEERGVAPGGCRKLEHGLEHRPAVPAVALAVTVALGQLRSVLWVLRHVVDAICIAKCDDPAGAHRPWLKQPQDRSVDHWPLGLRSLGQGGGGLVVQRRRPHEPAARGETSERRRRAKVHRGAADRQAAAQHRIAKPEAERCEELVERGQVGAARDGGPLRLSVVVVEVERASELEVIPRCRKWPPSSGSFAVPPSQKWPPKYHSAMTRREIRSREIRSRI